jgi:hypothetical protein
VSGALAPVLRCCNHCIFNARVSIDATHATHLKSLFHPAARWFHFMATLKLVKSLWGVDDALRRDRWPALLARIRADGYSAVECNSSVWRIDPEAFTALLCQNSLLLIAQIHTTGSAASEPPPYSYMSSRSVEQHVRSLRELVAEAKSVGAFLVNSHSG